MDGCLAVKRRLLLILPLICGPALAQPADDTAARCAEAAERYRAIFGRDAAAEPVKTVLMFKYRFCPATVTVKAGEALRYVNVDRRTSHSVWLKEAGQAESERVFAEGTVDIDTRLPAGAHPVLCGPHWHSDGMTGTIIVEK